MTKTPRVSVVMSAFNDANLLHKSISSVLNQRFTDFEFIIINDGSSDQSEQILKTIACTDQRIKLIHQANNGLTKALIKGCQFAKGEFIARQDVGDYSFPTRFEKQVHYLESNADCVACFSHYNVVNEDDIIITRHRPSDDQVHAMLDYNTGQIATPSHHGCAMIKAHAYSKANGYRAPFYFTQDLDLWIRLNKLGRIHVIDELLYHALLSSNTISGKYHHQQKQLHNLIVESAILTDRGEDDNRVLIKASEIGTTNNSVLLNKYQSNTLYFIGSCLLAEEPELAKNYLKKSVSKNPANFRAWYKLLFKT